MSIKIRTVHNGRVAIFDIKGSLVGGDETDFLKNSVADFIEQGNKCLVINLQKVNYMNSSGIGAVIAAHTSYMRNGGEIRLAGVSNSVQNLLVVTRLIDVFDVYETVDAAIESFIIVKTH